MLRARKLGYKFERKDEITEGIREWDIYDSRTDERIGYYQATAWNLYCSITEGHDKLEDVLTNQDGWRPTLGLDNPPLSTQ